MCEAIRGMVAEGVEQGVNQFASLTEKLLQDSRTDDLLKATKDKLFREQLFQEYGIDDKTARH